VVYAGSESSIADFEKASKKVNVEVYWGEFWLQLGYVLSNPSDALKVLEAQKRIRDGFDVNEDEAECYCSEIDAAFEVMDVCNPTLASGKSLFLILHKRGDYRDRKDTLTHIALHLRDPFLQKHLCAIDLNEAVWKGSNLETAECSIPKRFKCCDCEGRFLGRNVPTPKNEPWSADADYPRECLYHLTDSMTGCCEYCGEKPIPPIATTSSAPLPPPAPKRRVISIDSDDDEEEDEEDEEMEDDDDEKGAQSILKEGYKQAECPAFVKGCEDCSEYDYSGPGTWIQECVYSEARLQECKQLLKTQMREQVLLAYNHRDQKHSTSPWAQLVPSLLPDIVKFVA
jgi:hypothetical protein